MEKDCWSNYLTLDEYERLAVICILSMGYRYVHLLRNEDAIAYVMNFMIRADQKYNVSIGHRGAFRMDQGKYACRHIIRNKKISPISLDGLITYNNGGESSLHSKIASTKASPAQLAEIKELVNYIDKSTLLSAQEKLCVRKYFMENNTESNIALELKLTQERVSHIIKTAIIKLRWKFNEKME